MHDIERNAISAIQYLLKQFPCVAILGSRQVGKTTLMKQVLPNVAYFDLEKRADFERIQRDPDFFLDQYSSPIAIDEAQILPELFPALRVKIDSNRHQNGQILLSGSSSPELLSNLSESLAGRMAVFELHGLSLDESWQINSNPVYKAIVEINTKQIIQLQPGLSTTQLLDSCLKGSYPEPFLKHRHNEDVFALWMENYHDTYINRDIRTLFPGLNMQNYQKFISMLASSTGQMLNYSEFARSLDVAQPTIKSYFNIAEGTFVWRMLNSFEKNVNKRVVKMSRGHMRDSGLLNHLLMNQNLNQLQTHHMYGRIWESFIIEELLKGFGDNLIKVKPYYYRTTNQAEIDLIIEGAFGIIPIEIKSGYSINKKDLTTLNHFINDHSLPLGLVINQAKEISWLSKNILQIPAHCL